MPEVRIRTVWITRALPGAHATANRVASLGFEPILAPLIEVQPTGAGPIDLAGVGALAFTSANGVWAFASRSDVRDLPVFTVGAATARSARSAGFADVRSAEGDVTALAAMIKAAPRPNRLVLHAGAAEPAGDLVGALTAAGIAARRLDVYESVDVDPPPDARARLAGADIVLVHSPRAAAALARVIMEISDFHPDVLCLSAAIAAPLEGLELGGLAIAAAPTEDALMALLTARRSPA
jgi:uroporphyrinogen-III synthase